jgi:hypothetical protein
MGENPPVNVFLGDPSQYVGKNVVLLYRDKLAERLNIKPKDRLTMTLIASGDRVLVSVLLDGGDLTPGQEAIFKEFLVESGVLNVIESQSERPTTS